MPPPCSPPGSDVMRTVRQPVPRDKSASKFRVWRVEESDAPSSTPSDAEGPSPEEIRQIMRNSPEEEYVSKRREMKARKKASGMRQSKTNKGIGKQRASSNDRVKTTLIGKKLAIKQEETDEEYLYGPDTDEDESCASLCEDTEGSVVNDEDSDDFKEDEDAHILSGETTDEDSDGVAGTTRAVASRALPLAAKRRGRAATKLQEEAVFVNLLDGDSDEEHADGPTVEPEAVAEAQPVAYDVRGDPALPPPHEAPFDAAIAVEPDANSIDIVNPAHPLLGNQPPKVKAVVVETNKLMGSTILLNGVLMDHDDRNGAIIKLGVKVALRLGHRDLAATIEHIGTPQSQGFYRLVGERVSTIRGNMKNAIKPALSAYSVPLQCEEADQTITYLKKDWRYIYSSPDVPHWQTAYMHPVIVHALRILLFEPIRPARMAIVTYDPDIFQPADDAYGFEKEIPDTMVASAATLIFYTLDCLVRDRKSCRRQPDITDDLYRKEFLFHSRTMEYLRGSKAPNQEDPEAPIVSHEGCVAISDENLPPPQLISFVDFDDGHGQLLIGSALGDALLASVLDESVITPGSVRNAFDIDSRRIGGQEKLYEVPISLDLPSFYNIRQFHSVDDQLPQDIVLQVSAEWSDSRLGQMIGLVRYRLHTVGEMIPVLYRMNNHEEVVFRVGKRLYYSNQDTKDEDGHELDVSANDDYGFLGVLPFSYDHFVDNPHGILNFIQDHRIQTNLNSWTYPRALSHRLSIALWGYQSHVPRELEMESTEESSSCFDEDWPRFVDEEHVEILSFSIFSNGNSFP
ncbi:hypothetical protein ACEPAF_39 [Sanghuangporus sanghuang]